MSAGVVVQKDGMQVAKVLCAVLCYAIDMYARWAIERLLEILPLAFLFSLSHPPHQPS